MGKAIRILPILTIFILLAGAGIRMAGGQAILSADMVYRAAGEIAFPGTETPEGAAVSFYMYIDRGMYEKAYQISVEPDYTAEGPAPFRKSVNANQADFQGITKYNEFTERLQFELGRKGMWIKLHNIRAEALDVQCTVPEWLAAQRCIPVRITGHLLGACTIFSWEKTLPVIPVEEGYAVVLPGTKREKQFYYQDWIMNITKIFDLRGNL